MTDDTMTPSSPALGIPWCPGCEPDRDPFAEILSEDRCGAHRPSVAGLDDARVEAPISMLGNSETDGDTQREMARLLRG